MEEYLKDLKENNLIYLNSWIANVRNDMINDSILLVNVSLEKYITEVLLEDKKDKYTICNFYEDETEFNRFLRSEKNKIIFYSQKSLEFNMFKNKDKFLFIYNVNKKEIEDSLDNLPSDTTFKNCFFIRELDICELIKRNDYVDDGLLRIIVAMYLHFFSNFYYLRTDIFKDIKYESYLQVFELYNQELDLLFNKKILTSKFAVFLYRLTSFDFTRNIKQIGTYYANNLRTSSKTFNLFTNGKMNNYAERLKGYEKVSLGSKSFKAYDLLVDEKVENIKKEIARNLLYLSPPQKLDKETIAKVTNLPLEVVKKIV